MPFLPFAEFLPDQPDFQNPGSSSIFGVVPKTQQSYGPFQAMTVVTGALATECLGATGAKDSAATQYNFAGTASKLYEMSSTLTWTDVSVAGGYNVASNETWSFTQFGDGLLACTIDDPIQLFTLGVDSAFSNLATAAPKARYMTVSKNFLLVANTTGGTADPATPGNKPQRVWWPKIGDPSTWPTVGSSTATLDQSDFQDLPADGGEITGIVGQVGSADAIVYMRSASHMMMYIGSPDFWGFYPRSGVRGCVIPRSIQKTELGVIYAGPDDFYLDAGNALPVGIGNQKMAKTFWSDINTSFLWKCSSALDPSNKLYYFAYVSLGSADGSVDTILICNYSLTSIVGTPGRWSMIRDSSVVGEGIIFLSRTLGYNADNADGLGFNTDTCPYGPDSPFWISNNTALGMFDTSHKMNTFSGNNIAATLQTSETEVIPGRRARVNGCLPIVDAGSPTITPITRNRIIDSASTGTTASVNSAGFAPLRTNARYQRMQCTIPANTSFTHAQGVEVPQEFIIDGGLQ